MIDKNENKAMIEAVALLAKEKNIGKEVLFSAIEEALKSAERQVICQTAQQIWQGCCDFLQDA